MHAYLPSGIRHLSTLTLLLLLGISPTVIADEATDRAALETATQTWIKAFNARDADALVALTTDDVVLLDPNVPPVSGRQAARAAWQHAMTRASSQVTIATKELVVAGDVAWRIGALTQHARNGDLPSHGQSLEIWKRVNGQWKLHRQMSSNILARSKLPPRPLPSEPVLDKLEDRRN